VPSDVAAVKVFQHAISISTDKPIGRLELIQAIMKSCKMETCKKCDAIKQAARFLSKEMVMFSQNNTTTRDKAEIQIAWNWKAVNSFESIMQR
jgi:hypothetical protein